MAENLLSRRPGLHFGLCIWKSTVRQRNCSSCRNETRCRHQKPGHSAGLPASPRQQVRSRSGSHHHAGHIQASPVSLASLAVATAVSSLCYPSSAKNEGRKIKPQLYILGANSRSDVGEILDAVGTIAPHTWSMKDDTAGENELCYSVTIWNGERTGVGEGPVQVASGTMCSIICSTCM